ncbi:hypothetical protein EV361DRAFT_909383 [Lentinula raphanica]|nr:hypothetical protein F5880DRAFT_1699442 [Lentinula raphanica]KAJ3971772.1 hypothetical protein EV361DRAFT_909383 [Lentinula raphanica]
MKRGAEKQLTKNDRDDDEDTEYGGQGQVGLQKAEDSVLATRKMKGLPKRAGSITSSPSSDSTTASRPTFPFGTGSGSSFQFTPPVSPFPSSNSTPTSPFAKPTVSSSASNTAKTFSNLLGSIPEPQSSSSVFNPAPLTSQPTLPDVSGSNDDPAFEYYKSLRGLNASITTAITRAIERDPFADISFLLERYRTFRSNVQKEYDEKTKMDDSSSSASLSTASVGSFSMPTPPTSFSGFGAKLAESASSSKSGSGGFTPKLDSAKSSSSPFSFPSTTPSSTSSFSFPPAGPIATPFSNAGSIANPFSSPSSKPSEATPKPAESSTTTTTTSLFGPKGSSSNTAFSFGTPPSTSGSTPNLFGAPPSPSIFGMPSSTAASTSSPFGTSGTTSKFGGFGGFGGAGKSSPPAGSLGNPVGFGFGSPSKPAGSSGFSFAKPPSTSSQITEDGADKEEMAEADEKADGGEEVQTETNPDPAAGSKSLFGVNPHDEEGEGEENEETLHAIRSKAFRMQKDDKGASGWADLGTGILRLKKHKETGQRRLLLRNSNTGKIIINFNLYTGLKPTVNKKALMFVGHEGGVSQTYNLRTKTEDQAVELKTVLDREIAFVKAKQQDG